MILPSFTYDELIQCLTDVAKTIKDRAMSFGENNFSKIQKQIKLSGKFDRVFSAEINGQRYYQKFSYGFDEYGLGFLYGSLVTELIDNKRRFVIAFFPDADKSVDNSRLLKLFTGHFLERFFERSEISGNELDLCHKCLVLLSSKETNLPATTDDDVIRRYGEPLLTMKILPQGERLTECLYRENGDICIVERYGSVAVWRTYISKEMLFDSQQAAIDKLDLEETQKQLRNLNV